jgi:uncharacterized protein (DUF433 family)
MTNYFSESLRPEPCGGTGIRGMSIRVLDVLDLLVAGLSRGTCWRPAELGAEDIGAALQYTAC